MPQSRNSPSGSLRPLNARSVALSTLLGMDPPVLDGAALVASGELFGIATGTTRVALSRMVAAGELVSENGRYALAGRMLERRARQETGRHPSSRTWDGTWHSAVVQAGAREAAERASLRKTMTDLRFAELRDGVWLRPTNLPRPLVSMVDEQCHWFSTTPHEDPVELAASLWDLPAWARTAGDLSHQMATTVGALRARDPRALADTFVIAAAVTRHLTVDPLLPRRLLPKTWPGRPVRTQYDNYQRAFAATWRAWYRAR